MKVIEAKNSLKDTIDEQDLKLKEVDDLKMGADIHAENLEQRVCLINLTALLQLVNTLKN